MFTTLKSGSTITATATATMNNIPSPWGNYKNQGYTIRVNYNGSRFSFRFWDSVSNYETGAPCDIRGALSCFASDAFAGMNANDANDIMDEFGYEDIKEARRVFKGVKEAQAKAEAASMTEDDLSELANY